MLIDIALIVCCALMLAKRRAVGLLYVVLLLAGVSLAPLVASSSNWWDVQIALQDSRIVSTLAQLTPTALESSDTASTATMKHSVFKVLGKGCGGIIDGSGFVIKPDLIATNAHVVAGIKQSYVQNDNGIFTARVVWFDPQLDLAILQVNDVKARSIPLAATAAAPRTTASVLGYPGGGAFSSEPAVVAKSFSAVSKDIYGHGRTNRPIYELRTTIGAGNSGGPLIDNQGRALGILFAVSTTAKRTGYALHATAISQAADAAVRENQLRSTGSCVADHNLIQ